MSSKKFILGLLAYGRLSLVASKKEILGQVRQKLSPAVECWHGSTLSHGQMFWGAGVIEAPCDVFYFSGLMTMNDPKIRFHRHEFLAIPRQFIALEDGGHFGFVMETRTEFSYKKGDGVVSADYKGNIELYLLSYILENEYANGVNLGTDFVSALKKFVDKLIKRFDVLEVSSAWGGRVIHIAVIKGACASREEQANFLEWIKELKNGCDFNPNLDSEGIASGNSPVKLALVRNLFLL